MMHATSRKGSRPGEEVQHSEKPPRHARDSSIRKSAANRKKPRTATGAHATRHRSATPPPSHKWSRTNTFRVNFPFALIARHIGRALRAVLSAVLYLLGETIFRPVAWLTSWMYQFPAEVQFKRTTQRYLGILRSTESYKTFRPTAKLLDSHLGIDSWRLKAPPLSICNAEGLVFEAQVALSLARTGNPVAMGYFLRGMLLRNAHGMTDPALYPYFTGTKACIEDYCAAVSLLIGVFGGSRSPAEADSFLVRPCLQWRCPDKRYPFFSRWCGQDAKDSPLESRCSSLRDGSAGRTGSDLRDDAEAEAATDLTRHTKQKHCRLEKKKLHAANSGEDIVAGSVASAGTVRTKAPAKVSPVDSEQTQKSRDTPAATSSSPRSDDSKLGQHLTSPGTVSPDKDRNLITPDKDLDDSDNEGHDEGRSTQKKQKRRSAKHNNDSSKDGGKQSSPAVSSSSSSDDALSPATVISLIHATSHISMSASSSSELVAPFSADVRTLSAGHSRGATSQPVPPTTTSHRNSGSHLSVSESAFMLDVLHWAGAQARNGGSGGGGHNGTADRRTRSGSRADRHNDDNLDAVGRAVMDSGALLVPYNLSARRRLNVLNDVLRSYGRTALILSGGASMGTYHTGVIRALFEAGTLPDIMSGSSAGSIIAALICTKAPKELKHFVEEDILAADAVQLTPFGQDSGIAQKLNRLLKTGFLMDVRTLMECVRSNCGDMTFLEAYTLSGRVLNICVTRDQQKGTHFDRHVLLNYLTTPNVVIWSAVSASCALPGLFNAVQLIEKSPETGYFQPYLPGELYCDGSVAQDVPRDRLAQLFNVNYFVVSQVNPYVIPFLHPVATNSTAAGDATSPHGLRADNQVSLLGKLWYGGARALRTLLLSFFDSGLLPYTGRLEVPYLLLTQSYSGHVTILPVGDITSAVPDYLNMVNNPSPEYVSYVASRAQVRTWPLVARIKSATAIERALLREMGYLERVIRRENRSAV